VWLGEEKIALASIIFVGFPWVGVFPLLIYLSGLISIPQELFDAAIVDGVSAWGRFWHIDIRMLLGQVRLLVVLTFIGTMQEFFLILIMTGGGPYSSTYVPALELYYAAFRFSKFGYASAIALALFAIIMAATIFNMRFRSAIEYQA
jgi:ABC-type sugar transport system permease subunit